MTGDPQAIPDGQLRDWLGETLDRLTQGRE